MSEKIHKKRFFGETDVNDNNILVTWCGWHFQYIGGSIIMLVSFFIILNFILMKTSGRGQL